MTYRGTVAWSAGLPAPVQTLAEAVSEYGILGLIALFGVAAWRARRYGVNRLARGIAAGFGVIGAYIASESMKMLVTEMRPCHNFSVRTITSCPEASDWSWPSNHATIAVAIAVGVLAMAPRLGLLALPMAGLVATCRVVVGVHYFHDVLAGALLGTVLVILAARWGTPPVRRLLHWSTRFSIVNRVLSTESPRHQPGGARRADRRLSRMSLRAAH
ncbi:phosphatase PAP2 family protein [Brachybacterium sp. GCM10030267]|uniref:phosphatase PAP2 family protein n=1 Tax=Brachybacterium sp. GCM10030267 TaxID=3273381 RepID=UPI00361C33A4